MMDPVDFKKVVILVILAFLQQYGLTQNTTYKISDFSDIYYATIEVENVDATFTPGQINVFEKSTNKEIISVLSEELFFHVHDGEIKANIIEKLYGEQSVLIYEDFNFDGEKDFAIMDGHFSCYHGPSFNIYLANGKDFIFNQSFTDLAHNYCGMFTVDHSSRVIRTMTKSGCCWHQYCEFSIIDGEPFEIKTVEESLHVALTYIYLINERIWDGNQYQTSEYMILDEFALPTLTYSFNLAENKKKVYLIYENEELTYLLVDTDGKIEFVYSPYQMSSEEYIPIQKYEKSDKVEYSFSNKYATYTLYSYSKPKKQVGIRVKMKGKIYDLKGDIQTIKGDLANFK